MSRPSEQAPIRIALVITTLEPGGAELCLTNVALGLSDRGFEPAVHVLAGRPPADKDALVQRLDSAGISCRFLNLRRAWQLPRAVSRLRAAWREQRPEIVQSFLYHANVVAALAASGLEVPHVTGVRVAEPRKFRLLVERLATRRAARITCVSRDVAEHMRSAGFDLSRLVVIPNSVDVDQFDQARPANLSEFGIPDQSKVIIYVGRLDRQKGTKWLVEQTPELLKRHPTSGLLLLGDGPEQNALARLIDQLGVSERVHLAGWRTDVAELMKAASVLVLPSRWEGMPNAVLQAMACGLPVVCSRTHGMAELLGDDADADAQLFEFGSAASFIERLSAILSQPDFAVDLGKRNRTRVEQCFSPEEMLNRYEQTYRELLAR